jgi:hypothetical protein
MPPYDPAKWMDQLMECQHLPEADMKTLCEHVRALLMEESNIQPVASPVTICGDIHGQFWDLRELLRRGGPVPETSYIFMVRVCVGACRLYVFYFVIGRLCGSRALQFGDGVAPVGHEGPVRRSQCHPLYYSSEG